MKLVYVAGSYTADCGYKVHQNIHRAWEMGVRVAELGAMPVIPHTNTAHMDGVQPYQFWADGTMELMRKCDAVLVLEGWEESKGTIGEIGECNKTGKPLFYNIDQLKAWLESQE